ncbi:J domain-containing protein [Roseospirillum parvum]|uniref:J domain-containing protein n=1 Tax=Roseospirillum parvum TaxID=83401 RepID=A0A1G7Z8V7_9PROT|nr:J domain-containing protein [Roseospirillum parvum]SDH04946.1 hypothetical protein SAMN05421742_10433 [Roseospirillum parvum]
MLTQRYTVPCATAFALEVREVARRRGVAVADLARAALLTLPPATLARLPDPGPPAADDMETVILRSGPAAGQSWHRRPRLQVRLAPGLSAATIRRALALALDLDGGRRTLALAEPAGGAPGPAAATSSGDINGDINGDTNGGDQGGDQGGDDNAPQGSDDNTPPQGSDDNAPAAALSALKDELERLHAIVAVLAFEPLPGGILCRADALHVMGFPPGAIPDERTMRARFRMLATIHHPDGPYGSHRRMSQLNQAMQVLRAGLP